MSARNRPQVSACSTTAGSERGRGTGRRRLGDVAGAVLVPPTAQGVEQAAAGRRADPEEQPRPQPLVDAGVGVLRRGGHRLAPSAGPVWDGKSAAVSEFQVICGAMASIRSS